MTPVMVFRRVAAIAILLGTPLLVWSVILRPAASLILGEQDGFASDMTKLALLRRNVREAPVLLARLHAAQKEMRASKTYWHQSSMADISAAMQARIRQVVVQAGGTVISTADLAAHTDHDFLQVQVRANISQPAAALYRTLQSLESAEPALVLNSLELKPSQPVSPTDEPQVAVDIVLSAYQPVSG